MAKPRLAQAAREDIREIRNYSKAAFGASTALNYVEGLRATLKQIGETPLMGSAERSLGEALRSFPYRSHRIYYRTDDPVLIVRILHHAQDSRALLGRVH